MNVEKIRNLTDVELTASAARAVGPALQDEVSVEDGADREPEEDPRAEEGHCAHQHRDAPEAAGRRQWGSPRPSAAERQRRSQRARAAPKKKAATKKAATEKKVSHGRNNSNQQRSCRRPPQDPDRRSGVDQDGEDHRGRGPAAEGAPVLQARGVAQQEVLCP